MGEALHLVSNAVPYAHRQAVPGDYREIADAVCASHGVNFREVLSGTYARNVVAARWEIAYRLRHQLGMSFPTIARRLGMSHSGVYYACKRFPAKFGGAK